MDNINLSRQNYITDDLIRLLSFRCDALHATSPTTALVLNVYDSDHIHNNFILTIFRLKDNEGLIFIPFFNDGKDIGLPMHQNIIKDVLGNWVEADLMNDNLNKMINK